MLFTMTMADAYNHFQAVNRKKMLGLFVVL